MIFSFLLCIKLQDMSGEVDMTEFRFLLTGGVSLGEELPEKPCSWIEEKGWAELNRAMNMPNFKGFREHFLENLEKYSELAESQTP